jgi:hypothetical protein
MEQHLFTAGLPYYAGMRKVFLVFLRPAGF